MSNLPIRGEQQLEMTANTAYAIVTTWLQWERSNPLIDGLTAD